MNLLLSIMLSTVFIEAQSIIAYDCSADHLNITSFSSLSVAQCEKPLPTKTMKIDRIKLIQKTETHSIYYKTCLIAIDYLIFKCSTFGDLQALPDNYYSEVSEIGTARCEEIHKKLIYQLPQGGIIQNLRVNHTTKASYTIAGSIDHKGNCEGTTFISNRGTYHKAIAQAKFEITLTDGYATANYRDNSMILPNGIRFPLSAAYGFDSSKGEIIWNTKSHDCDIEYDVLYDGPAAVISSKTFQNPTEETKTFLVETEGIAFALKYVKNVFACGTPVVQTEHPQLYIITLANRMDDFSLKPISPQNTELISYVNTKFVWLEYRVAQSLNELYIDIITKQCLLERKLLLQKLSLATYSLTEFAYAMCETHGCVAFSNGEIIYLMKCKPVLVTITKKNTCFNELPVLYQNQSYFMSPKSHILQRYGTEITCNIRFPSAYFIEGEWLGLNPYLTEIKTPQTLHPETKFTWKYKSLEYLISAGIYNQDVMQALQKHLMFAQEVTAIQNNIVRQTLGYEVSNQLNLHRLIDPTVISDMVEDKLHKMWGWFTYFGSLMSGVLGIIFMIKIITLIINACMNIQLLYNTFGWSIRLLGGLFNNITHYFMHQNHQQQYNNVVDLYNVKAKTPNPPNTQINFRSLLYPDLNQQNIE